MRQNQCEIDKYKLLERIQSNYFKNKHFNDYELEILEQFSKDIDDCIRLEVAKILVNFTELRGENILVRLINDRDSLVRVEACDSLRYSKSESTFDLLIKVVKKDKNSMVRGYAISSLGYLADTLNLQDYAIKFLEKHLKNEKAVFGKINSYTTLYLLGKGEYLGFLILELNARIYQNRCAVVHCLEEILNENNSLLIKKALNDRKKIEKTYAVISSIDSLLKKIMSISK